MQDSSGNTLNVKKMPLVVENIIDKNFELMDENNKKAATVLKNQGIDNAVEFMFKHPKTGKPMDYATMRYYYG
jgi:hypothetical protein